MLEWQVLAGAGVSVLATNPRGSEGYGEEFNRANLGDWGDGPMARRHRGIDQAIADGLADPERLGVTGGSYGGYLTNWIIGKTQRFKAAITCRSCVDMRTLFLTGDISGGEWASIEFGRNPRRTTAYFYDDLAAVARRAHAHAAAHPAQRARPAHDGRPGRGTVHGPAVATSGRSGSCGYPTSPTS